ncbi:MAG: glutamate 5-kinase [Candidatus Omnitrophica bacterium]|nr:glutamate 5-kinase [Candidatus Omnitrophota bacterium]
MREAIRSSQRIVIKAGTSILTGRDGWIQEDHFSNLCRQIVDLVDAKKQVVLVSSGAIAFGMQMTGIKKRPRNMPRLQACAAIGQGGLMHAYERYFSGRGLHAAQLLLTRDGLEIRKRFLGARHTLDELFKMKVIPIVNENDTVATEEIAFGDNDILSVHVAHLIHADLLIMLSDVDGFYLQDGSRIRQVSSESEIDSELVRHLKDTRKERTVGGMKAKLEAARVAMRLGVPLVMVNGHDEKGIRKIFEGEDVGTLFVEQREKKNARRKWIAFSAARKGALILDAGACEALRVKKKSLLPKGIVQLEGEFEKGQVVELRSPSGEVFGRGVVRYSSQELKRILGRKTSEIEEILGYKYQDEVIQRNDLVFWE